MLDLNKIYCGNTIDILKTFPDAHFAVFPEKLVETPIKAGCPKDGIVLDPFVGSGTVAVKALKEGMQFVGIEINPKYAEMANERIRPLMSQKKIFSYDVFDVGGKI